MEIKILGTGCAKCNQLESLVRETIKEEAIVATIKKIKDIDKIMAYPVLITPALIINEKIVFSGKVPSKNELSAAIREAS